MYQGVNAITSNAHPRLFFIHIPKCAGMTLSAIIDREYEPEQIYTMPSSGERDEHFRALRYEWKDDSKEKVRIVKGHIVYSWHEAFDNDSYEYLTIMRNPIERILSYFCFIGCWNKDSVYSIDELPQKSEQASNLATYMLGGERSPRGFKTAWSRILTGKIIAGTSENFDDYIDNIRARYSWSSNRYEHVNVTPRRIMRSDLSKNTQNIIIKQNWYDYMLYAGVVARNDKNGAL